MPWKAGVWVPREGFEQCSYVFDGETVYAPYNNKGTAIRCRVQIAAGHHALVVNERYNFRKWFDVLELFRKVEKSCENPFVLHGVSF